MKQLLIGIISDLGPWTLDSNRHLFRPFVAAGAPAQSRQHGPAATFSPAALRQY
jgi:hypothetical protein